VPRNPPPAPRPAGPGRPPPHGRPPGWRPPPPGVPHPGGPWPPPRPGHVPPDHQQTHPSVPEQPADRRGGPRPAAYVYNPYGEEQFPAVEPYPGGYPTPPPRRPVTLVLALLFQLLGTVPYLAAAALLVGASAAVLARIPPEVLSRSQTRGVDTAELLRVLATYVTVVGGVVGAVALLFLLFAGFAFAGRGWARVVVTLMTVPFALLSVLWLVVGFGAESSVVDPGPLAFAAGVLAGPGLLAVLAAVLLFTPAANRFFAGR